MSYLTPPRKWNVRSVSNEVVIAEVDITMLWKLLLVIGLAGALPQSAIITSGFKSNSGIGSNIDPSWNTRLRYNYVEPYFQSTQNIGPWSNYGYPTASRPRHGFISNYGSTSFYGSGTGTGAVNPSLSTVIYPNNFPQNIRKVSYIGPWSNYRPNTAQRPLHRLGLSYGSISNYGLIPGSRSHNTGSSTGMRNNYFPQNIRRVSNIEPWSNNRPSTAQRPLHGFGSSYGSTSNYGSRPGSRSHNTGSSTGIRNNYFPQNIRRVSNIGPWSNNRPSPDSRPILGFGPNQSTSNYGSSTVSLTPYTGLNTGSGLTIEPVHHSGYGSPFGIGPNINLGLSKDPDDNYVLHTNSDKNNIGSGPDSMAGNHLGFTHESGPNIKPIHNSDLGSTFGIGSNIHFGASTDPGANNVLPSNSKKPNIRPQLDNGAMSPFGLIVESEPNIEPVYNSGLGSAFEIGSNINPEANTPPGVNDVLNSERDKPTTGSGPNCMVVSHFSLIPESGPHIASIHKSDLRSTFGLGSNFKPGQTDPGDNDVITNHNGKPHTVQDPDSGTSSSVGLSFVYEPNMEPVNNSGLGYSSGIGSNINHGTNSDRGDSDVLNSNSDKPNIGSETESIANSHLSEINTDPAVNDILPSNSDIPNIGSGPESMTSSHFGLIIESVSSVEPVQNSDLGSTFGIGSNINSVASTDPGSNNVLPNNSEKPNIRPVPDSGISRPFGLILGSAPNIEPVHNSGLESEFGIGSNISPGTYADPEVNNALHSNNNKHSIESGPDTGNHFDLIPESGPNIEPVHNSDLGSAFGIGSNINFGASTNHGVNNVLPSKGRNSNIRPGPDNGAGGPSGLILGLGHEIEPDHNIGLGISFGVESNINPETNVDPGVNDVVPSNSDKHNVGSGPDSMTGSHLGLTLGSGPNIEPVYNSGLGSAFGVASNINTETITRPGVNNVLNSDRDKPTTGPGPDSMTGSHFGLVAESGPHIESVHNSDHGSTFGLGSNFNPGQTDLGDNDVITNQRGKPYIVQDYDNGASSSVGLSFGHEPNVEPVHNSGLGSAFGRWSNIYHGRSADSAVNDVLPSNNDNTLYKMRIRLSGR